MSTHILIMDNVPQYRRIKAARTLRGWRQTDLSYFASEELRRLAGSDFVKVTTGDVWCLENDLGIKPERKAAILAALGLEDDRP